MSTNTFVDGPSYRAPVFRQVDSAQVNSYNDLLRSSAGVLLGGNTTVRPVVARKWTNPPSNAVSRLHYAGTLPNENMTNSTRELFCGGRMCILNGGSSRNCSNRGVHRNISEGRPHCKVHSSIHFSCTTTKWDTNRTGTSMVRIFIYQTFSSAYKAAP